MLILHETYDHWSVAVLTVTLRFSFVPTFHFFKKYVAFCIGFNLLTLIFMLPYIIMDVPIYTDAILQDNEKFKVQYLRSLLFDLFETLQADRTWQRNFASFQILLLLQPKSKLL